MKSILYIPIWKTCLISHKVNFDFKWIHPFRLPHKMFNYVFNSPWLKFESAHRCSCFKMSHSEHASLFSTFPLEFKCLLHKRWFCFLDWEHVFHGLQAKSGNHIEHAVSIFETKYWNKSLPTGLPARFNAIQHKGDILPIRTCGDFYVSFVYRYCHEQSTSRIVPWLFRQSIILTIDNSTFDWIRWTESPHFEW